MVIAYFKSKYGKTVFSQSEGGDFKVRGKERAEY